MTFRKSQLTNIVYITGCNILREIREAIIATGATRAKTVHDEQA